MIEINLFWIFAMLLVIVCLFLVHNYGGVHLFVTKDREVAKQFLEKFPLVTPEFILKDPKAQNIENNQEIHEINKKLEELQEAIEKLNKKQTGAVNE